MKILSFEKFSVNEIIRKEGGKYVVRTRDRKRKLGTHKTRKKAEKQLAAIEISKHMHESADPTKEEIADKWNKMDNRIDYVRTNCGTTFLRQFFPYLDEPWDKLLPQMQDKVGKSLSIMIKRQKNFKPKK